MTKRCSTCKRTLELDNFCLYKAGKFGRYQRCRECEGIRMAKRPKRNPRSAKIHAEAVRKSIEKYPEKQNARKKMKEAVKKGLVIKQPCSVCGKEKVHGHHEDYSKPLEVIWLCATHHMKLHYRKHK